MTRRWAAALTALALAMGGCVRGDKPQARSVTTQATDKKVDPLREARTLALAPVKGDGAVDKMIRKRQKSAKLTPKRLDRWILLGYAWARKARASGDSGYYLHAKACLYGFQRFRPVGAFSTDGWRLTLRCGRRCRRLSGLIVGLHPATGVTTTTGHPPPAFFDDREPYIDHPVLDHIQRLGGAAGQVDDAVAAMRATVVDLHLHGLAVIEAGDPQDGADGEVQAGRR